MENEKQIYSSGTLADICCSLIEDIEKIKKFVAYVNNF